MIHVLIADDQGMVRTGLASLLEDEHIQVVAEAADGGEGVVGVSRYAPDVALMGFRMPGSTGIARRVAWWSDARRPASSC